MSSKDTDKMLVRAIAIFGVLALVSYLATAPRKAPELQQ